MSLHNEFRNSDSDKEHQIKLANLARLGDEEAFNKLFAANRKKLYNMLRTSFRFSPENAEDILQQTAIASWRGITNFQGNSSPYTWLYTIAQNKGRNFLKSSEQKRQALYKDFEERTLSSDDTPFLSHIDTPEEALNNKQLNTILLHVLDNLQEDIKRSLHLRDFEQYSYEDIAEIENVLVGTVKSRIFRGREAIRAALKAIEQEEVNPLKNMEALEDSPPALLNLYLKYAFPKMTHYKRALIKAWEEERCLPPLTEETVIEQIKLLNPTVGTPDYNGHGHLHEGAQNALGRLELSLLLGWRQLPGGQTIDALLYKHELTNQKPLLSEEFILVNILKHYLENDKTLPPIKPLAIAGLHNEKWKNWKESLHVGNRGLNGGMNWEDLLVKYNLRFQKLSEELIIKHALIHYKEFGSLPNKDSGQLLDVIGENWHAIDNALKKGQRGITAPTTLNELYIKYGFKLGSLTEDIIIDLIVDYVSTHKTFPSPKSSHSVGTYIGETWNAIAQALEHERRDLKRKISLPQLIKEFITNQAQKHVILTGQSKRFLGSIPDYPRLTWETIDTAFQNMGGSHKTSLAKVLADVDFSESLEQYHRENTVKEAYFFAQHFKDSYINTETTPSTEATSTDFLYILEEQKPATTTHHNAPLINHTPSDESFPIAAFPKIPFKPIEP